MWSHRIANIDRSWVLCRHNIIVRHPADPLLLTHPNLYLKISYHYTLAGSQFYWSCSYIDHKARRTGLTRRPLKDHLVLQELYTVGKP